MFHYGRDRIASPSPGVAVIKARIQVGPLDDHHHPVTFANPLQRPAQVPIEPFLQAYRSAWQGQLQMSVQKSVEVQRGKPTGQGHLERRSISHLCLHNP